MNKKNESEFEIRGVSQHHNNEDRNQTQTPHTQDYQLCFGKVPEREGSLMWHLIGAIPATRHKPLSNSSVTCGIMLTGIVLLSVF